MILIFESKLWIGKLIIFWEVMNRYIANLTIFLKEILDANIIFYKNQFKIFHLSNHDSVRRSVEMAIRFTQLKSFSPVSALLNAGVFSVAKKTTAPVSMKIRICQGSWK